MGIDEIKKELEKEVNKVAYLKRVLEEEKHSSFLSDIRSLYISEIKKKGLVKLSNYEEATYSLLYDSMSEGLEPIYFWVLDFLSGDVGGLGFKVDKTREEFDASVSSSYYGDIGSRQSVMQDRAMRMLQLINTLIRSIINLIYDLKEFDVRLKHYELLKNGSNDDKEAAELAIKSMWMDQVDIKKGRGSINLLVQQLGFATIRDAFMVAKSLENIDKLDLNTRVKNILKHKYKEYEIWKTASEYELTKRRKIEQEYLRSQVESLKLYTKWAKPYLKAAQKLGSKDFNSPHVVSVFNNMEIQLSLFGKKEVKPGQVFEQYNKLKFDKKYFACIEVEFKFRSVPQSLRGQGASQYIHSGSTEIIFRPYVFTDDELKEIEKQELYEDMSIVENLTDVSLSALQNELDEYLKDKEQENKNKLESEKLKKKNKREQKFSNTFGKLPEGFNDMVSPIRRAVKNFALFSGGQHQYASSLVYDKAKDTALKSVLVLYDVYKKTHGMLAW